MSIHNGTRFVDKFKLLSLRLALVLFAGFFIAVLVTPAGVQTGHAQGEVIYVNCAAMGNDDGASWDDAYIHLQSALDRAAYGDEIWVAQGVYTPTQEATPGAPRTATFQMLSGVALYGGFVATETLRTERDWVAHVTVLSGDLGGDDLTDPHGVVTDTAHVVGDNACHVVVSSGVTETAVLDGFAVTAGKADEADPHNAGGGMYNTGSSPTLAHVTFSGNQAIAGGGMCNLYGSNPALTDVIFTGNEAADIGGGMYNEDSYPTLAQVVFHGNEAISHGGGLHNQGSSPTLTGASFVANRAMLGGGMCNVANSNPVLDGVAFDANEADWYGGGMYNYQSFPYLSGVAFSSNHAEWAGGGMYNYESDPHLTGAAFEGNHAGEDILSISQAILELADVHLAEDLSRGGGMYNFFSNPVMTDTAFLDNQADSGGGIYSTDNSHARLTNTRFGGNRALLGGGMHNDNSCDPTLRNVLFSGNQASVRGGGMLNNQASMPTLTNVAFGGNRAEQRGGGLRNANGSHAALVNCILWGNDALEGPQIDNYRSTPTVSYSLAQGSGGSGANWDGSLGSDGGGNLDADPQFVAPVDAGQSPTAGGNYRLLPGSPAIDAGDNTAVTVDTDLDGNARIAGGAVDMGPYEAQYTTVLHYLPLVLKN